MRGCLRKRFPLHSSRPSIEEFVSRVGDFCFRGGVKGWGKIYRQKDERLTAEDAEDTQSSAEVKFGVRIFV